MTYSVSYPQLCRNEMFFRELLVQWVNRMSAGFRRIVVLRQLWDWFFFLCVFG